MLAPGLVAVTLLGVLLAVPYVALARRSRRTIRVFAAGLVAAGLIYVAFAVVAGDSRAAALEVGGVALFGAVAVLGVRGSAWWLAAGWTGHVAWDLLLHPVELSGHAPWWYPVLCLGFDLFVAGFVAGTAWSGRRDPAHPGP